MTDLKSEISTLLVAARERGSSTVGGTPIPPELDYFTVYVGLIGSALELGKLVQTEKRDVQAIQRHYKAEMARINAGFKKIESAMLLDFQHDATLKDKTFESINMLIAAGQYEIALEFQKRMIEGFRPGALETVVKGRNRAAKKSGTRLRLR